METITIRYEEKAVANILGYNNVEVYCIDTGAIFQCEDDTLICKWNGGVGTIPVTGDITPNHVEAVQWEASKDSWANVQRIQSI
jgi:hypothetical protein